MPIWEYKIITSGKGGFVSPQLLEQHLNQLGKEEWEIIDFRTQPDNPLAFQGLARRTITRDWFPKPDETKPAYVPPPIPKEPAAEPEDDRDERSFADELPPQRPVNAPAQTDLGLGNFDDLGSEEDLPTLFEALKPFLRKNQRGDQSVGLDFLAKKFEQDERELQGAFEECGLKAPAGPGQKGEVVEHAGALYWLESDRKGQFWLNTREKKFKTVKGTPVPSEQPTQPPAEPASTPAQAPILAPAQAPVAHGAPTASVERPERAAGAAHTLLGRICGMMRRNRHGGGLSGSFGYLTKALKMDAAQLLSLLGEQGLRLPVAGEDKPTFVEEGGLLFWLNKNHRGEIWINARQAKHDDASATPATASAPAPEAAPAPAPAPENTLAAVRLLLQPKKRGPGVAAQVGDVAQQLGRSEDVLLQALVAAGLNVPATPKDKPAFGAHGGEIFWMNRNPRGQLWLNAKEAPPKKARTRKDGSR